MVNKAAVAVSAVGLGILGVIIFSAKKASAATPPGGGGGDAGPSEEDKVGLSEAQTLASMLSCSSSNNPATLRSCAQRIRNYNWEHAEVRNEAFTWASNLDAKAQDLEDYQQAQANYQNG